MIYGQWNIWAVLVNPLMESLPHVQRAVLLVVGDLLTSTLESCVVRAYHGISGQGTNEKL